MREVNRRSVLAGLSGTSLAALLHTLQPTAEAEDKPALKRERFVVGPFNLGDWFKESKKRMGGFFQEGAPKHEEIVKSLGECSLYVLDERVWRDAKKIRFADKGPMALAAGKLNHVWKTDNKTFIIQINNPKASSDLIDYVADPPHQRVHLSVELATIGIGWLAHTSSTIHLMPQAALFYDINGKLRRD